jgi:hypothetical protein
MSFLNDYSGLVKATGKSQVLLEANQHRNGWLIQNRSGTSFYVNETDPASVGPGSWEVQPGDFFPPLNYPVPLGVVNIIGASGQPFTVKEW